MTAIWPFHHRYLLRALLFTALSVSASVAYSGSANTPHAEPVRGDWRGVFSNPPRYGHSAVHIPESDRLIVFGGHDGTLRSDQVWVLSLAGTPSWTFAYQSNERPSARYTHSAIHDPVRGRMIVFGGDDGDLLNDVWEVNLDGTMEWNRIVPDGTPPPPRRRHTAIYDPAWDRMIVFGGRDSTRLDDVWALSLSGSPRWDRIVPNGTGPSARYRHSAVYDPVRHRMLVFGGDDGSHRNDVWSLSLTASPTWEEISPEGNGPSRRRDHVAAYDAARDRMLVFGGPEQTENDAWALSLSGAARWTELVTAGVPPAGQSDLVAAYDPGRDALVLYGGRTIAAAASGETSLLSLRTGNEWSRIPVSGYGGAASKHSVVYDSRRKRMIAFGGLTSRSGPTVNTTRVLALDGTYRWSALETSGPVPPARKQHMAIYDPSGDRMIVHGGYAAAGNWLGKALRDTWALSLSGLPTWTEIESQGGPPSFAYNYKAVYDPRRSRLVVIATDHQSQRHMWTLPLTGPAVWENLWTYGEIPVKRHDPSLTYDPVRDRLVLFGGSNSRESPSHMNTVYTLSMSDRTWTRQSPEGVPPSGRERHSAIYDPIRDRLVIASGEHNGYELSEVWALELGGPMAWTPLAPTGYPPKGREWHDAVYWPDDDAMIVYGGGVPTVSSETWVLTWDRAVVPAVACPLETGGGPGAVFELRYPIQNPLAGERAIGWTLESEHAWPGFPMRGVLNVDSLSTNTLSVTVAVPDSAEAGPNRLTFSASFAGGPGIESSCTHEVVDATTSTLASLITAGAEPGVVRLSWHVTTGARVTIERREQNADWVELVTLVPDRGALEWSDDSVVPGHRYGYRLSWNDGLRQILAGETWVDVPSAHALAFHGVRPNPAATDMSVALSLPAQGRVTLALYDVSGRRVGGVRAYDLPAGFHVVPLKRRGAVAPGVYLVRMRFGDKQLHRRAVVVR